jgi:hypothetical protein
MTQSPKQTSYGNLPKFSEDPTQNAEMTAEYLWDCRISGENPYGYSRYEDDDNYDDYDDENDDDE